MGQGRETISEFTASPMGRKQWFLAAENSHWSYVSQSSIFLYFKVRLTNFKLDLLPSEPDT